MWKAKEKILTYMFNTKISEVGMIASQTIEAKAIGLNLSWDKLSLLIWVPMQKRPIKRQILFISFK